MKVKELYENMFDDDEDNAFDISKLDDSAFGFDLDSNKSTIGHFYIFLTTVYNLIDVKLDKTPIIDSKGQIQGYVRYSISFDVLEQYGEVISDLLDYENMADLLGKKLRLNFEIKDGEGLPNKLCTKTFCQYEFYQTKDPNAKKAAAQEQVSNGESTAAADLDASTSEDEDELDARIGDNNDASYVKVPKRQRKLFETRVVEEKVHDP